MTTSSSPSPESGRPRLTKLAVPFVIGVIGLIGGMAGLGYLFREPLTGWAVYFVDHFGHWGIFGGVLVCDFSPIPIAHEPFLFLGISGGLSFGEVLALACVASITGGLLAFGGGRRLGHLSWVERRLEGRRDQVEEWIEHYGVWAVVVAALSPVPYALTSWVVGALQMRALPFALATLCRIPRIAFYLWLMELGWPALGQ